MLKDPDPEPALQSDEQPDEFTPEVLELDPRPTLPERFFSWLEKIDR